MIAQFYNFNSFYVCFKIKESIDKKVDSLELKDIAIKFFDRHEDFVRENPNTRILKQVEYVKLFVFV
jgi:hypothetical protein